MLANWGVPNARRKEYHTRGRNLRTHIIVRGNARNNANRSMQIYAARPHTAPHRTHLVPHCCAHVLTSSSHLTTLRRHNVTPSFPHAPRPPHLTPPNTHTQLSTPSPILNPASPILALVGDQYEEPETTAFSAFSSHACAATIAAGGALPFGVGTRGLGRWREPNSSSATAFVGAKEVYALSATELLVFWSIVHRSSHLGARWAEARGTRSLWSYFTRSTRHSGCVGSGWRWTWSARGGA